MSQNKISQFRHREVRDLAWALSSPSILDETSGLPLAKIESLWGDDLNRWLSLLDVVPQPLLEHIASSQCRRLGQYFEALLLFALASSPDVTVLLKQQVFQGEGRTLGECDVIFRECSGRVLHWELTVKFYLYHQGRYWGANVRDRLDKKCQHLRNHQLQLPHRPVLQEKLREEYGIQQLDSQVYMKGRLFYPLDFDGPIPVGIAEDHCSGRWCSISQLLSWGCRYGSESRYRILPRLQWLAEDYLHREDELLTLPELQKELEPCFWVRHQAKMVVMLMREGKVWCEQQRCIVVDDGWPESG